MKTPLPHVLFTTVVVVLFLDMDDDRSVRLLRLVCDLVLCPVAVKQSLVMVQFLSDHLHRSRMVKIFFQLEMDGLQQASGFDSFHGKFPPDVEMELFPAIRVFGGYMPQYLLCPGSERMKILGR